jgi:TrmH family RNA methyltransferase
MGTIIRTACWFGIEQVICSEDSADCYNPKVVQASMGGVFHVKVSYCNLSDILKMANATDGFTVYGTFIDGKRIWDEQLNSKAIIVFGNESRGISGNLMPYIKERLTIPGYITEASLYTDSLNVASSVAIICSAFRR